MITEEQVELLNKHGFEALPEVSLIRDKNNSNSSVQIIYNKKIKNFELGIIGGTLSEECFYEYARDFFAKAKLVEELNDLAGGNQ